jgi:hypothetical protein
MSLNSRFLRHDWTRVVSVVMLTVLAVVALPTTSFAQRLTGGLSITIEDSTGAAVSGAQVTITNRAQGNTLTLKSGPDGIASAPDLSPADYSIAVKHEGFKTASSIVAVRVGITSSLAIKMEVGSISTSVEVAAEAVTIDTEKSAVQNVITASQIDALPLNGRNFLDLAQLAPGVQVVDGGLFDPTKNQMTGVSIGGRSGRSTRIQVDGVDITDETVGTTVMNLSNEAVQEFGVQQSSLDVSTDLTSSGAVNIITKSGTNTMHGSGFGFFRRDSFSANTAPEVDAGTPKPPFSRDNYGGRLGGPIFKNKLFWQAEYEKLQQQGALTTNTPFDAFNGSFGVPVGEHTGGGRLDFNLTDKQKLFYRFNHDDNLGVTGFGGLGLSAFANSNSANAHVAGWDYGTGAWVHSIRFSFLKFINGIVDANSLAGTPGGTLPAQVNIQGVGGFVIGPNANAPQDTYQQNRQTKYDATYVKGKHEIKFGIEYNRIDEAGFASFFGLGPRVRGQFSHGVNADPFSADGAADPLNFNDEGIFLGNGLGAGSEKPELGFPNGGFANNRIGVYAHDTWKLTRNFTVNFGLRYDHDDGLSNADLARAPLISTFDPELGKTPKNDNKRFAPQAGFSWNVKGDGKTVIRGGGGLYYETNIFNNLLFDRTSNLAPGLGNDTPLFTAGAAFVIDPRDGSTLFDFLTDCTGVAPSSATPNNCFAGSIGASIPFAVQAEGLLKAASAQLAANWPAPGSVPKFNIDQGTSGGSLVDPNYRSPYGTQINIGVQRELRPGLVLSADYIMNRGVHFNTAVERNRIGAANTLNVGYAQGAIAATLADCGVASIDAALVSCAAEGGDPATISDFANEGLGGGNGPDGFLAFGSRSFAFPGNNTAFRNISVIESGGLSRYSALQVLLAGKLGTWGPFKNASTNITYTLSRFNASSADQDFIDSANTNDNPTAFYGPSNLDRTHQFGFSILTELPLGFRLSSTTIYRSNEPSNLFLATGGSPEDIFENDLDGDGSIYDGTLGGDAIPGTNRGAYGRGVNAGNLVKLLNNFNNTVAGTLTPAGKALVDAGLFTQDQLAALGGTVTPVSIPTLKPVNNPNFYTTDLRLSWHYAVKERLTIEPMVDIFNLLNRDNRVGQSTLGRGGNTGFDPVLSGGPGSINGDNEGGRAPLRVGSGSGSFSSGNPRAFQFGVRVSF